MDCRIPVLATLSTLTLCPGIASAEEMDKAYGQDLGKQVENVEELQERLRLLEERQQELEEEIIFLRNELEAISDDPMLDAATMEEEADEFSSFTELESPEGLEFSVEALFFDINTSDIQDFAILVESDETSTVSGDVVGVEYDDDTALRFEIGYRLPKYPIDISASYAFLDADGSSSVSRPIGVLSTIANPAVNNTADSASADLDFDYRVTDVAVGYTFDAGQNLDVRLFAGLRFADIDQDLTVAYEGVDFTDSEIRISQDLTGYGLRLGSEASLELGGGFSLFARASGSALISDFSASFVEEDDSGNELITDLDRDSDDRLIPVFEAAAGINWDLTFSEDGRFFIAAGYEFQNWFNVVNNVRFVDNSGIGVITEEVGDLSLEGIFVRAGFSLDF